MKDLLSVFLKIFILNSTVRDLLFLPALLVSLRTEIVTGLRQNLSLVLAYISLKPDDLEHPLFYVYYLLVFRLLKSAC